MNGFIKNRHEYKAFDEVSHIFWHLNHRWTILNS